MSPRLRAPLIVLCLAAFLTFLSGQALAETVGVIVTRDVVFFEKLHNAFKSHLASKGYEGRVKFITQRPYPDSIAWSNASRKLIAADVDVIVTYGAPATISALKEQTDIPVIYAGVYEPVAAEIKAKNATGVSSKFQVSSLLRYLRASTSVKTLGIIYSGIEADSAHQFAEISALAGKYGIAVAPLNLRKPGDIAGMLADVEVSAFVITSSSMASGVLPTIMNIARGRKIPTASLLQQDESLATIMLSSDPEIEGRMAAEMLIKVLNGTPPSAISPGSSKKIDLVFNLREARQMGIRVSMDLVTEATRIIY